MVDEIDNDTFCNKYPLIARTYLSSKKTNNPFSYYGVECGPGWLDLIEKVCTVAEKTAVELKAQKVPTIKLPKLLQVKEKFGLLRMYIQNHTEEIDAALKEAEHQSAHTCEVCGEVGSISTLGWIKVRCKEHSK